MAGEPQATFSTHWVESMSTKATSLSQSPISDAAPTAAPTVAPTAAQSVSRASNEQFLNKSAMELEIAKLDQRILVVEMCVQNIRKGLFTDKIRCPRIESIESQLQELSQRPRTSPVVDANTLHHIVNVVSADVTARVKQEVCSHAIAHVKQSIATSLVEKRATNKKSEKEPSTLERVMGVLSDISIKVRTLEDAMKKMHLYLGSVNSRLTHHETVLKSYRRTIDHHNKCFSDWATVQADHMGLTWHKAWIPDGEDNMELPNYEQLERDLDALLPAIDAVAFHDAQPRHAVVAVDHMEMATYL